MELISLRVRLVVISCVTLCAVGCSKPSMTVSDGKGGEATISKDGEKVTFKDSEGKTTTVDANSDRGTMKVQGPDGTATYESGKTVSEEDLGIPFYPGSIEKKGASVKVETPEGKTVVAVRTTGDVPSKVTDFYKPKLKEANSVTSTSDGTESQMLTGKLDSGVEVLIGIKREKGSSETEVSVSTTAKKAR